MPDIRKELENLRRLGLELEGYPERIARLRSAMEGLNRVMRNSPASHSVTTDKLSRQIAELEELEQLFATDVIEYERRIRNIQCHLKDLPGPQRQIMELRYIHGLKWREVSKTSNYSSRRCMQLHSDAINQLV